MWGARNKGWPTRTLARRATHVYIDTHLKGGFYLEHNFSTRYLLFQMFSIQFEKPVLGILNVFTKVRLLLDHYLNGYGVDTPQNILLKTIVFSFKVI